MTAGSPLRALLGDALVAHGAGDLAAAERGYATVIAAEPGNADALFLMGLLFRQRGELSSALGYFSEASRHAPTAAACYLQQGEVLLALDRQQEAEAALQQAVALDPAEARGWAELGGLYGVQHRFEDAKQALNRALALNPDLADAHINLGVIYMASVLFAEAATSFETAVRLDPQNAVAWSNLGNAQSEVGHVDRAVEAYDRALALGVADAATVAVKSALALPVIAWDWAEIRRWRAHQLSAVTALHTSQLRLEDPLMQIGRSNFRLAYHGLNDREMQEAIARMYRHMAPVVNFVAPHCAAPRLRQGRKLRLGILSQCLWNHSIGAFWIRTIERLDPERFDVFILRERAPWDDIGRRAGAAPAVVETVVLNEGLAGSYERVAALELDVIAYPDIGILPLSYFMALGRLAPVQCVSFGHPVTTGIDTLDYFLSTDPIEPEDAQDHYTEKLVRFGHHPTAYQRTPLPSRARTRAEFGLPETGRLYFCSQTPFKLHPDIDASFAGILEGDPHGWIVQVSPQSLGWIDRFRDRFRERYGALADRVILLDSMDHDAFMGLTGLCDVILDSPHFGGATTVYQAFIMDKPVVTWPGDYVRARYTLLFYKRLGIEDCIATSPEDFARIALRLAQDPAFYADVVRRIVERREELFDEVQAVDEQQAFFEAAYDARVAGLPPIEWKPWPFRKLPWLE